MLILCPICGARSREFLPAGENTEATQLHRVVGAGYRNHARCPVCRSGDRERLVYLYCSLKSHLLLSSHRHVLHVAPERALGHILRRALRSDYRAVDLVPRPGVESMDITEIELPSDSLDVILCNHVLEHIVDDRRAMREMCRVLRPGGWAVLQVPLSFESDSTLEDESANTPEKRHIRFGQADHVRIYGRDYFDRLAEAGFGVTAHDPNQLFGAGVVDKYGLLEGEHLIVATKPD